MYPQSVFERRHQRGQNRAWVSVWLASHGLFDHREARCSHSLVNLGDVQEVPGGRIRLPTADDFDLVIRTDTEHAGPTGEAVVSRDVVGLPRVSQRNIEPNRSPKLDRWIIGHFLERGI